VYSLFLPPLQIELFYCTSSTPVTLVDVVSCQTVVLLICWQQRSNVNISETLIPTSTLPCWMKCSEIMGQCMLTLSLWL